MIEKFFAACAATVLLFVLGTIVYNEVHTSQVTIVVDLKPEEDPFMAIREIIPKDSIVTKVETINQNKKEYQLTVQTKRKKQGLVDCLMSTGRVTDVKIKE